jgi:hypothetical protein
MALPKYQKEKAKAAGAADSSSKKRAVTKEPEPAKKRSKVAEKKAAENAAAEKRAAITAAIQGYSSLPEAVREVLCSSLPGCCSLAGPFHPYQEKILRMVNQVLNDIETESLSKRSKAAKSLTVVQEDLARREKAHADAEAALETAKTLVQSKEQMLSEGVAELQACATGLPKAQEELSRRDTLIGEKVMEIEIAREALAKMAEDDRSEETVRALLRELSFPVDNLQDWSKVQSEVSDRITMLRDVVSQAGKSRKELVAKLKVCQAGVDGAREKQQAREAALTEAQSDCEKRAAALKEAAGSYTMMKKILSQTTKAYRAAQDSVFRFQEGALAAFQEIAREIEQQHEVSFLMVNTHAPEEHLPLLSSQRETPRKAVVALSCGGIALRADEQACDKSNVEKMGTPVIDRSKRDAVLRRRSAILPLNSFARKSLLPRRASVVRTSSSHETKSFKSCGSDSDAEDATAESEANGMEVDKSGTQQVPVNKSEEECNTIDGLADVPTPQRNSIGSAA